MRSTVSCGWLMKATWELSISIVFAPARAAIARSATGGIAWSLRATMYQLGSVFHPAGPDGVPRHDKVTGRWLTAMTAARSSGKSAQNCS
jgi:hypothetical protein